MGLADAGVVELAYQNGRRNTRSSPLQPSKLCHGVILVSLMVCSGVMEVRLSVATHAIPLQYIHTVLYQCYVLSLPSPISFLNGSSCELNHISECDGETCKLHCIGHAVGTVCS